MRFERLRRFDFLRDGASGSLMISSERSATFGDDPLTLAAYDSGGDGLPVVFQHGLCGDARQTAEAFPDDPRFRLITLECRGHGASQAGENYSIATFADDVAALIEHLALAPVILGGISMGAAISSRLAVHRPDLIRGLILARPAWVTEASPENMRPNLVVGELLADALRSASFSPVEPPTTDVAESLTPAVASAGIAVKRARSLFGESVTGIKLAAEAPDNYASLLGFFGREPLASTSALLRSISVDGPGIEEADLRALRVPALILATDLDAIHPSALADRLANLIPGATLVKLTPKGVDKPAYIVDFHAALTVFLKDFHNA